MPTSNISTNIKTRFLSYMHPALDSGAYYIESGIKFKSGYASNDTPLKSARQYFFVAGERYTIPPNLVFACYPPKNSEGLFGSTLSHVELARATLPWERNVDSDINNEVDKLPWMALLLIDEADIASGKVTLDKAGIEELRSSFRLGEEPVDDEQLKAAMVATITVDVALLQHLLPGKEELKWLAHVRQTTYDTKEHMGHVPEQRAVLTSNRLIEPGKKYQAHIISLENRLNKEIGIPEEIKRGGTVRLISLYCWSFSSIAEECYALNKSAIVKCGELLDSLNNETRKLLKSLISGLPHDIAATIYRGRAEFIDYLKSQKIDITKLQAKEADTLLNACTYEAATLSALFNNLNVAPFCLNRKPVTQSKSELASSAYLGIGSVPMLHHMRAGGQTVSWYRGPLVPPDTEFQELDKKLVHQHPDELIQFNEETGLLDMSYAAAWQLGRLLFINEPKTVQQLQQWKQDYNTTRLFARQRSETPHLAVFQPKIKEQPLPDSIKDFLLQYIKFQNFPFNYIVPNKDMMPAESVRLFKIDAVWLKSFLYGIMSLGETIDKKKTDELISDILVDAMKEVSNMQGGETTEGGVEQLLEKGLGSLHGVLINSEVISGWPTLQVSAHDGKNEVAIWSKVYLSEGVLLCIFCRKFSSLSLQLPRAASHFSVDFDNKAMALNVNGSVVPINNLKKQSTGVLDFNILSEKLKTPSSAELAATLVHRQEKVTFKF